MISKCLFNPQEVHRPDFRAELFESSDGDRRDGSVYVYYDPDIQLAVCLALTTGRPLLIFGPTGCGKSELALNVARSLKWRYYEQVVTADTSGSELVGELDLVRRLNDAQANSAIKPDACYVEPGPLWWAFDPESARCRGSVPEPVSEPMLEEEMAPSMYHCGDARDPGPWRDWNGFDPSSSVGSEFRRAVVLIDEIDKAQLLDFGRRWPILIK